MLVVEIISDAKDANQIITFFQVNVLHALQIVLVAKILSDVSSVIRDTTYKAIPVLPALQTARHAIKQSAWNVTHIST